MNRSRPFRRRRGRPSDKGVVLLRARDRADVVGRAWATLWPDTARSRIDQVVQAALRGERTDFEASCPDFSGEPREWRVRVCPLVEAGALVGVLAVSTDVTARNRAVRAAQVLQASLTRRIEESQRASSAASMRVAGLVETLESAESRLQASNAAYQQLEVMHNEIAVGHRFALAAQQAAEVIAAQAQKGEAVGQLLAGVVHDLNNALQAAVSALDLVAAGNELGDRSRGYLAIAGTSLQQGVEMCRRLIGFATEYPYRPQAVDLTGLVGDMTPLLTQAVGAKARLTVDREETACCALADPQYHGTCVVESGDQCA